ncbi:hypothetical protein Q2T42_13670 [Leptolyngbya boryana CZ1]|uniref:Uncharacterized protein n=1 Tax=Leptolyngbya boryana CZ1 TaxID=3060204 RepID=A0AA96X2W4_LEPBY|nr:hypothetical protein [Leptolyngbya boryana]WNZ48874.1 hypothetical protein Q2T42_13670 [Leptolyngbya boryana CZ1]
MNGWLAALKHKNQESKFQPECEFEREWAKVMIAAGEVTKCAEVKRWGDQLQESLKAQEAESYDLVLDTLSLLLKKIQLEDEYCAVALAQRGMIRLMSIFNRVQLILLGSTKPLKPRGINEPSSTPKDSSSEYSKAIDDLSKAISFDANEAIYLVFRGIAYMYTGHTLQAQSDFVQATELDSELAEEVSSLQSKIEKQLALIRHLQHSVPELQIINARIQELARRLSRERESSAQENLREELQNALTELQESLSKFDMSVNRFASS